MFVEVEEEEEEAATALSRAGIEMDSRPRAAEFVGRGGWMKR